MYDKKIETVKKKSRREENSVASFVTERPWHCSNLFG